MARTLPPLTWFRSFEAAARTLSFTAAAEEIGLTQSAVSQQVKSLELRLGVPLFVRKPQGLALTDEGRKLLPQVAPALERLAHAAGSFAAGPAQNLLTIATSVSVAQWLITPHLPDFTATYPEARIRILSAVWPDDFRASRADVEIRFGSQRQVGTNAQLLEPNRLIAVKSPDLVGEDLLDLPLIETVGTSAGWPLWQASHGPTGAPALYTDTYGMALQMAAQGNGVALVTELLARHAIASGSVVAAHDGTIPGQEGYYLSVDPRNPVAGRFGRWLVDRIAGQGDGAP